LFRYSKPPSGLRHSPKTIFSIPLNHFASLFFHLDQKRSDAEKILAIAEFFKQADDHERIWSLALLTGQLRKRYCKTSLLKSWACEVSEIPDWLFEESYRVVGDQMETISKILAGETRSNQDTSLKEWTDCLRTFSSISEEEKKERITSLWQKMSTDECLVFTKIITGTFRSNLSKELLIKGIADAFNLDTIVITHRLGSNWDPINTRFHQFILSGNGDDLLSRPYPFFMANDLSSPLQLGDPAEWQAAWKWDGIRCQLVKRKGKVFLWNEAGELITDKFPELVTAAATLPDDIVLEGDVLLFHKKNILTQQAVQNRISRKSPQKKQLDEASAVFIANDLLEFENTDYRNEPYRIRQNQLKCILEISQNSSFIFSDSIPFSSWSDLELVRSDSGKLKVQGLDLKKISSKYAEGQTTEDFWFWKQKLLKIDGVLLYYQKSGLVGTDLTDVYTIAVWSGENLVPVAKVNSLQDEAIAFKVNAFIKNNTLEKFGPVRTVKPELVFEISFEGIQPSLRHKSGILLQNPFISSFKENTDTKHAHTLADLKNLL